MVVSPMGADKVIGHYKTNYTVQLQVDCSSCNKVQALTAMNTLCIAVFVGIVAVANASIVGLGLGHGGVDSAAVLHGPSGTVARTGLVAAPVIAAAPALAIGHGAIGLGLGLAVPAGSGLEGQWIPDINEKLHDDGSYKPHVYGW